ncbi:sensor histidine kinase [Litoreibacter albidus]|uniref:histidine kinase n=1 Tax=Litoreibacter albidus TaxID=670155 RepID=A0A1H3BH01_9RHOB|nr:HAMP domain-containing sensor histidine kinase [Litoreibacter albidus]SDX40981.1 histidine kinase [Litoreibacter albidus]
MLNSTSDEPAQELEIIKQQRRRVRDYAKVGLQLLAQRIVIYTVAVGLAGFYYDWLIAGAFYAIVVACEIYDLFVFRRIMKLRVWRAADLSRAMSHIYLGTVFSSFAVALFAISFALQQDPESGHFMPVFMLISASIFAAMNNHQFLLVLGIRLTIYVSAILLIPIYDIWITSAPITSEVWLHFFTVIFVLAFLVELARSFMGGYSEAQKSRSRLEEEHERTKAAFLAKNQFLSTISHELRTPLTSIKGALALVDSGALGELPEKARGPIKIADRNTHRLANLVDDLLLLQKADGGKLELTEEVFDLGELVIDATELFRPYAESAKVGIELKVKRDEFWVRGDRKKIVQVVTNLLSNAAKFSNGRGEILISVQREGGHICLRVTDHGIGIPEGADRKVFEEFGQVDSTDTRKFQGTGLGLNISKRIIEAHGGHIYYESVLGKGSTFYVEMLDTTRYPLPARSMLS